MGRTRAGVQHSCLVSLCPGKGFLPFFPPELSMEEELSRCESVCSMQVVSVSGASYIFPLASLIKVEGGWGANGPRYLTFGDEAFCLRSEPR